MKIHTTLLTALAIALMAGQLHGAEAESELTSGLGLSFGAVSGAGFSVRRIPEHGLGYHAATLYYKDSDHSVSELAFSTLYSLHRGRSSCFYLLAGFATYGTREKHRDYNYDYYRGTYSERRYTKKTSDTYLGFGCGFGWRLIGDFWSAFELAMTSYKDTFLPLPQVQFYHLLW